MAHIDSHNHGGENYKCAFMISVALNAGFVIIEVVYGIIANSLALLADAGNNKYYFYYKNSRLKAAWL
jgi:cobalt-zinc-cadmium efflux system protein